VDGVYVFDQAGILIYLGKLVEGWVWYEILAKELGLIFGERLSLEGGLGDVFRRFGGGGL